ncbi:Hypothetical protein LUCI_5176 [Lucifera butyrica]|uniref:EamA domain-containing protein n=1 Tax=Lucifera butyrica TaxID=1351585 RepID=A0A498RLD8_9FIRM|nr:DMT family transporter [Lucifera butyrica]VBB09878.1 Hypothetical protein LUCI_5176 [Lucifera butyrica]
MQYRSNLLLLLAAAIWGLAFVAQRVGMEHVGPFTFNGVRFALGGFSLIPLLLYSNRQLSENKDTGRSFWNGAQAGVLAGTVLFIAASLQQIGLIYTTAGKAAFITSLYIVLVPIAGIFLLNQRISVSTWSGCALALLGLYFLSVKEQFSIAYGDFLELAGALFWTAHILLIDRFARRMDALKLAFFQFITCSFLSLATALWFETITPGSLWQAGLPIFYGGVFSVGIAYTLQIIGQKNSAPSHAAILLSMETVFAALGGFMLLDERLGAKELLGCAFIFAGMLLSQLNGLRSLRQKTATT